MSKKIFNILVIAIIFTSLIGCSSQNDHLSKGKELIKSDKRRKEERAVEQFKLAITQDRSSAESHYLLAFYDEKSTIKDRGDHFFKAFQNRKKKYLEILVFETLRSQVPEIQAATVHALKKIYSQNPKPLIKHLKKAIRSKDNRDRHDAQIVLIAIGKDHPNEIVPFLEDLLKHRRMETRLNAVKALGEIGDDRAIPILVERINSGSAKWKRDREVMEVRQLAVEALGKIGEKAVPELLKIIENKGSSLRVDAILALEKLGDDRAIQPLIDVLSETESKREIVIDFHKSTN